MDVKSKSSYLGGYTAFPFTGATVQPEKGSAAWWFNLNSDGYPDYLTLHTACPVLYGQKWSKILTGEGEETMRMSLSFTDYYHYSYHFNGDVGGIL